MMSLIPPHEAVDELQSASARVRDALSKLRTTQREILAHHGFRDDQWQLAYDEGWVTQRDLTYLREAKQELERALEWYGEVSFSIANGQV